MKIADIKTVISNSRTVVGYGIKENITNPASKFLDGLGRACVKFGTTCCEKGAEYKVSTQKSRIIRHGAMDGIDAVLLTNKEIAKARAAAKKAVEQEEKEYLRAILNKVRASM